MNITSYTKLVLSLMLLTTSSVNALDVDWMFDDAPEKAVSVEGSAKTSVSLQVSPSGDETGVTDPLAIQAALDAATDNAEDQTTIVLEAGEFYLNDDLIVNGHDYGAIPCSP